MLLQTSTLYVHVGITGKNAKNMTFYWALNDSISEQWIIILSYSPSYSLTVAQDKYISHPTQWPVAVSCCIFAINGKPWLPFCSLWKL